MKVIEALRRIHATGVVHGDFDSRHVLVDGDKVRIVDFDHSFDEHECKNDPVNPYEFAPARCNFDCDELYDLALNGDVWTPCKALVRS